MIRLCEYNNMFIVHSDKNDYSWKDILNTAICKYLDMYDILKFNNLTDCELVFLRDNYVFINITIYNFREKIFELLKSSLILVDEVCLDKLTDSEIILLDKYLPKKRDDGIIQSKPTLPLYNLNTVDIIEPHVRGLCRIINNIDGCHTINSCEGHISRQMMYVEFTIDYNFNIYTILRIFNIIFHDSQFKPTFTLCYNEIEDCIVYCVWIYYTDVSQQYFFDTIDIIYHKYNINKD